MYGAKKNGKKKSDLPALSKDVPINKIGFNRFTLSPLYLRKKTNMKTPELYSTKSIETDFQTKRYSKELKVIPNQKGSVGCFGIC
jgi:hypothetical protein